MDIGLVKKFLQKNLGFSQEKVDKISKYIDLLLIFNKKYNLISKSTEKEVWNRHILDSAQIIKYIDFSKGSILSDFGSGAGTTILVRCHRKKSVLLKQTSRTQGRMWLRVECYFQLVMTVYCMSTFKSISHSLVDVQSKRNAASNVENVRS